MQPNHIQSIAPERSAQALPPAKRAVNAALVSIEGAAFGASVELVGQRERLGEYERLDAAEDSTRDRALQLLREILSGERDWQGRVRAAASLLRQSQAVDAEGDAVRARIAEHRDAAHAECRVAASEADGLLSRLNGGKL